MPKNKTKKLIKFHEDAPLKGRHTEGVIKRLKRAYDRHRAKSM